MKRINLNQLLLLSNIAIAYTIVICAAIMLANLTWWIISPSEVEKYIDPTIIDLKPEVVNFGIINKAPFGLISIEKIVEPPIFDQVKVDGIYAGGTKNSIAFLKINNKSSIATVGDNVLGAKIKQILAHGIILDYESRDISINLTSFNSSSTDVSSSTTQRTIPSNNYSLSEPVRESNSNDNRQITEEYQRKISEVFEPTSSKNDESDR